MKVLAVCLSVLALASAQGLSGALSGSFGGSRLTGSASGAGSASGGVSGSGSVGKASTGGMFDMFGGLATQGLNMARQPLAQVNSMKLATAQGFTSGLQSGLQAGASMVSSIPLFGTMMAKKMETAGQMVGAKGALIESAIKAIADMEDGVLAQTGEKMALGLGVVQQGVDAVQTAAGQAMDAGVSAAGQAMDAGVSAAGQAMDVGFSVAGQASDAAASAANAASGAGGSLGFSVAV